MPSLSASTRYFGGWLYWEEACPPLRPLPPKFPGLPQQSSVRITASPAELYNLVYRNTDCSRRTRRSPSKRYPNLPTAGYFRATTLVLGPAATREWLWEGFPGGSERLQSYSFLSMNWMGSVSQSCISFHLLILSSMVVGVLGSLLFTHSWMGSLLYRGS